MTMCLRRLAGPSPVPYNSCYERAAALVIVPLLLWRVLARRARPRRSDLSRRTVLRAGLAVAVAAGIYAVTELTVRLVRLPGARRRFTGSYEEPADAIPETIWLDD